MKMLDAKSEDTFETFKYKVFRFTLVRGVLVDRNYLHFP